ncbi:MAG: hypothetical protein LBK82_03390 [Planctomycetaceae bacterium]|nr:hypothetical protein [Planctomycetaceae bacterium]
MPLLNLIHCRRVRRRDLSAKGRPPTKSRPPDDCQLFDYFGGKHLIR